MIHASTRKNKNGVTIKKISCLELVGLGTLSWTLIWYWGPKITSYRTDLMAVGYILTLIYISYISPVLIHRDNHDHRGLSGWKTLFIRTDNLKQSLISFGIIILVGSVLIIAASLVKNPFVFQQLNWNIFFLRLSFYLLSSSVQGLFTLFILMRLTDLVASDPFQIQDENQSVVNSRIFLTVAITCYFSLIHMPNYPVVAITLVFTPVILWQYFKTPNFLMLILTHAILGTLLHRVYQLPMRIGPFYENPDRYIIRELFPIIGKIIGNSW